MIKPFSGTEPQDQRSQLLKITLAGQDDESLTQGEFFVAPKGMRHSPVADEECRILLIKTVTTAHTGTAVTDRTVSVERQIG